MWDIDQIDALTEAVVQRLLVDGGTARGMAPEVAAYLSDRAPTLPALCVALPFTLAAASIEEMLGAGAQARAAARDAWRVAALIGADALAVQGQAGRIATVAMLAAHWRAHDEVFNGAPPPGAPPAMHGAQDGQENRPSQA